MSKPVPILTSRCALQFRGTLIWCMLNCSAISLTVLRESTGVFEFKYITPWHLIDPWLSVRHIGWLFTRWAWRVFKIFKVITAIAHYCRKTTKSSRFWPALRSNSSLAISHLHTNLLPAGILVGYSVVEFKQYSRFWKIAKRKFLFSILNSLSPCSKAKKPGFFVDICRWERHGWSITSLWNHRLREKLTVDLVHSAKNQFHVLLCCNESDSDITTLVTLMLTSNILIGALIIY